MLKLLVGASSYDIGILFAAASDFALQIGSAIFDSAA
jgi:hypothetical protein